MSLVDGPVSRYSTRNKRQRDSSSERVERGTPGSDADMHDRVQIKYMKATSAEQVKQRSQAVDNARHPSLTESCLSQGEDKVYMVQINMKGYGMSEISVRTLRQNGMNQLKVSAEHKELDGVRESHITTEHTYILPANIDMEKCSSKLNHNGTLVIRLTEKENQRKFIERVVPMLVDGKTTVTSKN